MDRLIGLYKLKLVDRLKHLVTTISNCEQKSFEVIIARGLSVGCLDVSRQ